MKTRRVVGFVVLLGSSLVGSLASRAHADEGSALTPPPLAFSVTAGTGGGPWKLRVENTGDVPVRIAADPRLLVLEVTPPAGFVDEAAIAKAKASRTAPPKPADLAKPVRCVLPDDARPATDEGRELVVPAKRSWTATFDPLLYCFGARERAVLVNGATVTAQLGWVPPPPRAGARPSTKPVVLAPPFVAAPVGAAIGRVAPAKALQAAPITLAENVTTASASASASGSEADTPGTTLTLTMPDTLDVSKGAEISTTVTVANDGDKPVVLLFRPETLRFTVNGPAGSVACGTTRAVGSPIRELYSTLGVRARTSVALLITAVCPSDTFDEPGIYRVTPMLDTSGASARSIGLKTWDGTVTGRTPMLLRVRSARRAPTSTTRPVLD
ncbi:MAG: hypothetical protein JWP87_2022 [Labilithrix sp.]|jgi:hypothetical protein|nr:hypothetical protein [Labilithrix sp.]